MKKWILGITTCLAFFGFSFAQVALNPIYTSERFKPSDKFHAGCENQIDVVFHLDNAKINGVNAILHYDSNAIEVLKIVANGEKENNLTYTVENDKIIFSKLKSDGDGLDGVTFSVFFKSLDDVELAKFSFEKGSYVVDSKGNMVDLEGNYSFEFVEVPECDPDIVAPSVELLFPSNNTGEFVALDTYFQFKIDDSGKGVNEDSIKFTLGGLQYSVNGVDYERKGNILTIYPDVWMPFNTGFEVTISVSDKQSYGQSNTTTKIYKFQTSDELKFLNEISPVEFRKIVNMDKYLKGTRNECNILSELYLNSTDENGEILESINNKLNCEKFNVVKTTGDSVVIEEKLDDDMSKFSVFAMLGWILFGSSVLLMIFGWLRK